jgi:hypothetical protein
MTLKQALAVLAILSPLAGCGEEEPVAAPQTFAPLHYDYLTKLRLNVGSIDVEDHSVPLGANDIASQSPVTLAQAAVQMAHDRLFAAGLIGHADLSVDQASIMRGPNGVLDGLLSLHLAVFDGAGVQTGYAQARVTREYVPGSDPADLRSVLYTMTKQMLDDMNVELEFQIRRSLRSIIATGAPVPAPVTQAPLDAPPGTPLPPPSAEPSIPGATLEPPPAPQAEPPPPSQMSPPPGFLTLPPGPPQQ